MGMHSPQFQQNVSRPFPDFPPNLWDYNSDSFSSSDSEFESYTQEVEVLKEEVKDMLMESTKNLSENIELINLLCRLGVSYHFETQIENQLNRISMTVQNLLEQNDYDLYTVALLFRVLRQHGYNMSPDIFKKFKNCNGEFQKSIASEVKGLLSLYEATFLSFHGEDILEEALNFTKEHLEIIAEKSKPHLAKHINDALSLPFHHGVDRFETFKYISFYEQEEFPNQIVLKFAKLDFNRLQLLYRKELSSVFKWWKELNLIEGLPYARDRIMECYFWAVGCVFEPKYSLARLIGVKYIKMISPLDDTFDSYGTIDELRLFTDAIQRCSIDAMNKLPDYMKLLYITLLNLLAETESDKNEGIRYRTSFAKEELKELVRCYCEEAEWLFNDEYVPSFDEYVEIGLTTSTSGLFQAGLRIGAEEVGVKECDWMINNPKLFDAVKFIGRLKNDIMPHGYEIENKKGKGDCNLAVQSYMKQYSVSKEEAIERITKMCDSKWKDINEEYCKKPKEVSRIILKYYVNLGRLVYFIYKKVDAYTHSSYLKDTIESVFVHPLPI